MPLITGIEIGMALGRILIAIIEELKITYNYLKE